jgi:predicted HTH transcriptional regulator
LKTRSLKNKTKAKPNIYLKIHDVGFRGYHLLIVIVPKSPLNPIYNKMKLENLAATTGMRNPAAVARVG